MPFVSTLKSTVPDISKILAARITINPKMAIFLMAALFLIKTLLNIITTPNTAVNNNAFIVLKSILAYRIENYLINKWVTSVFCKIKSDVSFVISRNKFGYTPNTKTTATIIPSATVSFKRIE